MGKGGDKTASPALDANEVIINGRIYDITSLKHPGGSVVKFYAGNGIDASQAFNNFHMRSAKAKKYLNSLPNRPVDEKYKPAKVVTGQAELLKEFNEFSQQLEKEGFFKPSLPHVFYRVSEIILMHVVGLYLLFNGYPLPGIIILGVVSGRCGWLMHEGGHNSLTGIISLDKSLQVVLYGLGCGMSGSWWRAQHNKHHSMPQKLGHDVDLNTLPLVAFTNKVVKKMGKVGRWWIKNQALLFPLITTLLVALGWQFFLHPRHVVRVKNVPEMFSMGIRYVLWTIFVTPKFGLLGSTGIYLLYTWVGANYIFINFALSHTHLPVVAKDDVEVDWVRFASDYTINISPGPFGFVNWWMGYLNFQVEHHLFPNMPQFRQPRISKRVKAFFEKHGLTYHQRPYFEAMGETFANLKQVGSDVFLG